MSSIKDYSPSGNSKLKKKVKEAWLTALRGNRRQIKGGLRGRRTQDGRMGFCCLGVLCDLGKDASKKWEQSNDWCLGDEFTYDGTAGYPPNYVLERAGLDRTDAEILAQMNDNGIGFKRIARWIEKHL